MLKGRLDREDQKTEGVHLYVDQLRESVDDRYGFLFAGLFKFRERSSVIDWKYYCCSNQQRLYFITIKRFEEISPQMKYRGIRADHWAEQKWTRICRNGGGIF